MLHHEVDCADVDLSILIFQRGRCIDYHLRGVEPGKKGLLLTQKDSPYLYPQKKQIKSSRFWSLRFSELNPKEIALKIVMA